MFHPIRDPISISAFAGTMAFASGGSESRDRLLHAKVYITAAIVLFGIVAGVLISANTHEATQAHSEGILIDFAEYDVTWFAADYKVQENPVELLKQSCAANGYTYTFTDGVLTEVNGIANSAYRSWNLWYVDKDDTKWTVSDTYDVKCSDYSAVVWAYRDGGSVPTVAVDSSGVCIYGYGQSQRIVSLSPVATENIGTIGATDAVVGVDFYSNYPASIAEEKNNGMIAVIGTYTDPSFELIMKQKPDLVIGDGSQYNQVQVAKAVRQNGTNAIILYEGNSIQTIYDNLYIVGIAAGYDIPAEKRIAKDNLALAQISSHLNGHVTDMQKVMISLSSDISPYIAGNGTYVGDIIGRISAVNVFDSSPGWAHINTEKIASANPSVIIIVTDEFRPTQAEWDIMYGSLGDSWKLTDAYHSKQIYMLCEGATDLASRAAPRYVQLAELLANIFYPDEMGVSEMPKFIGNNYRDYLTITPELN